MDDSLTGLAVLGGFLLLSAVFKMAFVALFNTHKARLKELVDEGNPRAKQAHRLATDATRLLSTQQIVDLLLRFAIAIVSAVILVPPVRDLLLEQGLDATVAGGLAYGGVLAVVMLLTLVFAETLPANIALSHADTIALWVAEPITWLSHILTPVLRFAQWISGQFAAPFVGRSSLSMVTEEEIKLMVDAGSEGGAIENEEKEMIYSIFQFGDTLAREVMVPRIDLIALEINTPLRDALRVIVEAGHSRIPVYEESIDHIRGLLYAKDLLALWQNGETTDRTLRDTLRTAYFVPESKKAGDLLTDMQQRKIHIAIVIDEYGGTAGLVTLEDLVEEIVGEIRDEYDVNEEEVYQKVGENEYIFDAGIDLDDLNRLLGIDLPTGESDTLGGYIFSKLGKVPTEGEEIKTDGLHIEVLSVDDRRIRKIRLERIPEASVVEDAREEPAASPD
ncbi:MAG: HlyC/CorC family transporter [Chloroflexi bacterium]|nr:HlyC/CorC family transporter [Chloroflexota bacterium]